MQNNRVAYFDTLRCVSILAVIVLHVYAQEYETLPLNFEWYVCCVGNSLVKWCVPVFVMISGALFLNPNKDISIDGLIKKYIPRLLKAYIFWWTVYGIVNVIFKIYIMHMPFKIEYLQPWGHLWFIPMLIGLYLIVPFMRKIVQSTKDTQYFLLLWGIFSFFCFVPFLNTIADRLKMSFVIGFSGYFILGYYLSSEEIPRNKQKILYLIGILGGVLCIAGNIFMSMRIGKPDATFLNYLSPHVVFMSVAVFLLFKRMVIPPKIMKYINSISQDMFGVYLVHYLWLFILNTGIFRHFTNVALTLPAISILTFILSIVTVKVIRKTYFGRFVE